MRSIAVIDYGMGNLGSVVRALEECGAKVAVGSTPEAIEKAEALLLPGVGSFASGITSLRRLGLETSIKRAAGERGVPILGVCLGMQLLAEEGEEGGKQRGIGLIAGDVHRLSPGASREKLPHMGWDEVNWLGENPLFSGLRSGTNFYFANSYHVICRDVRLVAATTPYCGEFVSAVAAKNVYGVQFHPEKSQRAGLSVLRNFLNL